MVSSHTAIVARSLTRSAVRILPALAVLLLCAPTSAHASLLSPELEDKLATFIALFVLFVVPVVLKRNHPQFEAIRTLCLLSLVFGGLLWPIAWIWAYSKPVMHKLAYGTDKLHEHEEEIEAADPGGLNLRQKSLGLHERLARLEAQNIPDNDLRALRADLDALESKFTGHGAP
jgi:CBS domain containing-hemolysin-like protein